MWYRLVAVLGGFPVQALCAGTGKAVAGLVARITLGGRSCPAAEQAECLEPGVGWVCHAASSHPPWQGLGPDCPWVG